MQASFTHPNPGLIMENTVHRYFGRENLSTRLYGFSFIVLIGLEYLHGYNRITTHKNENPNIKTLMCIERMHVS